MKIPKYVELADRLRADIKAGVYARGERLPSENELAEQTGFSRQTVRQAMSQLENEGLANRVRGSGTFVQTTSPARERTRNIAVVTTYIGEYIFPEILCGIDEVLGANGYTSMLSATRNKVSGERRILAELLTKPIDGIIVEGTKTALPNPNIDLYASIAAAGLPVVFINGCYSELRSPVYVVADDAAGGRMACELLLEKGCARVAGIFKSDDIQGHRRYAGYASALRARGLVVDDDRVLWFTTENRDSLLTPDVLQTFADCDGIVCYNDEVALRLSHMLADLPDRHIRLASFDNSTYARLSPRPFISLSNPKEKLGELAAQKMIAMLEGETVQSSVLPWTLEARL